MEAGIFDLDDRSVRSVENDSDDSSDTDNADRGDHRDAEADAVTDVEPPPYSNPPEGHKLFTHEYTSLDDIMEDLHEFAHSARFSVVKKRPSIYLLSSDHPSSGMCARSTRKLASGCLRKRTPSSHYRGS